MKNGKILVIGSGLAAIGAIRALVDRGIKPYVIDTGESLPQEKLDLAHQLSQKKPAEWMPSELKKISENITLNSSGIPKKLLFGSEYFYGKTRNRLEVSGDGALPPFSFAKGGLSVGWGAAVLPPASDEIEHWVVNNTELSKYYEKILAEMPLSGAVDSLSSAFPLFKAEEDLQPLDSSNGDVNILKSFSRSRLQKENQFLYGKARLLTGKSKFNNQVSCQYCGICMSGCVYGCIYKASDELKTLIDENKIDYHPGKAVLSLGEVNSRVIINGVNLRNNTEFTEEFDYVFLAAGAVNSTRIILTSKKDTITKLALKSRGGVVIPLLTLKRNRSSLLDSNTQPGVFWEFRLAGGFPRRWIHSQISSQNELVAGKIGIRRYEYTLLNRLKQYILGFVAVGFFNFHSDYGDDYVLSLQKVEKSQDFKLMYSRKKNNKTKNYISRLKKYLFFKAARLGFVPLTFLGKNNTGSYHVGCTMPMKKTPVGYETDRLGRPLNYQFISVVDSSVFPELPSTTIGLLTLANAYRIASEAPIK